LKHAEWFLALQARLKPRGWDCEIDTLAVDRLTAVLFPLPGYPATGSAPEVMCQPLRDGGYGRPWWQWVTFSPEDELVLTPIAPADAPDRAAQLIVSTLHKPRATRQEVATARA
jgi:hypothetical protein